MGARSTYHVIVIHQIHLPRITLNRAHERLCSLHPLIDRRLAQSLHLCCLKSPLNAPDLQQWVWWKLGVLRSRLFSHFVVFRKISPDCVLSWQPINRSLGRQIETQCQDLVKAHHSLGIHDDCEGNLGRWWHGAVPVPTKGCFNRAAPFPSWLQTSISGSRFERVGSLNCSESLE